MDLSSWETINAASGAGASFMAKAASHFQQVAGNISGAGIVTNSAESSNIKNSIKPFAKADDSNEEAWIMGRKYYTQSGNKNFQNVFFLVRNCFNKGVRPKNS